MDPNQTAPFKEQSDQGFQCFLECIDKKFYMFTCIYVQMAFSAQKQCLMFNVIYSVSNVFLECIGKFFYMYICADGIFSTKTMFDVQCNLFSLIFCRKVLLSSMKMERRKITRVRGHH